MARLDFLRVAAGTLAATMYLIPSRAIAGRVGILLRTYRKYIVGNARGLLGDVDARRAEVRASA